MNFKHSGSIGDIIYSIPTILGLMDKTKQPANLFLQVGVEADWYPGCVHPAGDVRMDEAGANALIPLLSTQLGFAGCKIWQGEDIDVDLDLFRAVADLRTGHLPASYFHVFDAWFDLTQPWLWMPPYPDLEDKLIVTRTSRYRNPNINYEFLTLFNPIFVGLQDEFWEFVMEVPTARWIRTTDFYQAASIIHGGKAFVSNQCGLFAVAEGLKVPRCLEVCPFAPNVQPTGGVARTAINQKGFEANVRELVESS